MDLTFEFVVRQKLRCARSSKHLLQIFINIPNGLDPKVLNEHSEDLRRDERW